MKDAKITENSNWTFLTNHAHVLLCLAKSPSLRIRDLSLEINITERAVQRILTELCSSGYIDKIRKGRCNTYRIHHEKHLKHPVEAHHQVADLIAFISPNMSGLATAQNK